MFFFFNCKLSWSFTSTTLSNCVYGGGYSNGNYLCGVFGGSMKKKLTKEQKHWAQNVQTKPIPSWTEAFEYAYQLGLAQARKQRDKQDSQP